MTENELHTKCTESATEGRIANSLRRFLRQFHALIFALATTPQQERNAQWRQRHYSKRRPVQLIANTHAHAHTSSLMQIINTHFWPFPGQHRSVSVWIRELYTPPTGGCSPLKRFWHPQHRPPLKVLRVLTRTLVGSMLFSAVGGYCRSLNYYSRVYKETFVLNTRPPPTPPLGIRHWH